MKHFTVCVSERHNMPTIFFSPRKKKRTNLKLEMLYYQSGAICRCAPMKSEPSWALQAGCAEGRAINMPRLMSSSTAASPPLTDSMCFWKVLLECDSLSANTAACVPSPAHHVRPSVGEPTASPVLLRTDSKNILPICK